MEIKADFTNVLPAGCKSKALHLFIQSNLVLPCYDYPFFTPFTSIRLKKSFVLNSIYFFWQGGKSNGQDNPLGSSGVEPRGKYVVRLT